MRGRWYRPSLRRDYKSQYVSYKNQSIIDTGRNHHCEATFWYETLGARRFILARQTHVTCGGGQEKSAPTCLSWLYRLIAAVQGLCDLKVTVSHFVPPFALKILSGKKLNGNPSIYGSNICYAQCAKMGERSKTNWFAAISLLEKVNGYIL